MRLLLLLNLIYLIHSPSLGEERSHKPLEKIKWTAFAGLPSKPNGNKADLEGSFSGSNNNFLILAGGVSASDSLPFITPQTTFNADIYAMSLAGSVKEWSMIPDALPKKLAYGVSITLPEGILLIGGANQEGCQKDVYLLTVSPDGKNINIAGWPQLPVPLAQMTGAVVNNKIYLAGGIDNIANPASTAHFFMLDLLKKDEGWKSLDPWPGPPRAFALSAGQGDGLDRCFYLFSGIDYNSGSAESLADGYQYNPRTGSWKKLSEEEGSKFPVMGGIAMPSGSNHIIIIGGGNSMLSQSDVGEFNPANIYQLFLYHTITNTILRRDTLPFDIPVISAANIISGKILIPGLDSRSGQPEPGIMTAEFEYIKSTAGIWYVSIMIFYFGSLTWIGWYFARRQKNTSDFFRGGGKMPWWLVAMSIYGTTLSTITYMAIPAKTYATDWSYLVYNFGMITAVPVIVIIFIPFYRKLDITTAYEYLEKRFNVVVRVITSIAFMVFQIGRMAIVLYLPSIAINVITGIDMFLCIILMGIICLIYTSMGGIEAVIWTDALQVVILFGGAILALIVISSGVENGLAGIISTASADGKFAMAETRFDLKSPTLVTALIATFFANLTTYGTDQVVVQRYMTVPTEKQAKRSLWGKLLMALPGSGLFFFIGTSLYVFYKNHPEALSFMSSDQDSIFPWFIFTQLPQSFSAILLAGIFSAAMSTVSSSINSAATAYSVDIHFRFGWSKQAVSLRVARISSVLFGLAGTLFALMLATGTVVSLWDEFIKIIGLIMGGFGGLFLLGMLTKRANATGAIVGIAGSILVQYWVSQNQAVHLLLYVATGCVSLFVIGYIASLLAPWSKKDISNLTISGKKKDLVKL